MPGIFIWPGMALGCVAGVCAGLFIPGIFMSIFSAGAAGFAFGDGDGEAIGMFISGMDMSIFSGEAEGVADGEAVDDDGICMPGIFICSGDALG
jgi:hypothetical protein